VRTSRAVAAVLALVTLSGCATLVKAPADVETERLLPPGALAYARLDRAVLNAALTDGIAGIDASDAQSARAIIDKTDVLTLALVRAPGAKQDSLLAIAEGNYPQGSASFALATNSGWHRRGAIWERKDGTMNLAFVTGGRAIVGTMPIDTVVAAAAQPNAYPIPARWAVSWSAPVAIYVPRPMDLIAAHVPLGDGAIPMLALVVSAHPIHGGPRNGAYDTTMQFQFDSDRAALVFSPLCRIFLFAAAHALWPESAATTVDEAVWHTNGSVVTASGMALPPTSIAALAGGLSP
jgi:hypothetical protein